MAKKLVVTGGAGFIGSHIAEGALNKGFEVKVIDNLCTGKKRNLEGIIDRIEFVEGDLLDYDMLAREFKGYDFVSHQAALRSVPESVKRPFDYNKANIDGTLNVLRAAMEAGVKRVVYAASSSAYGDTARLPEKESDRPMPISPYAISKLAGEHYCQAFTRLYGLETVCLRYFNVFGERQDPSNQYAAVIPIFIMKILEGSRPMIFGDGKQSRDFTFVGNNVDANLAALKVPKAAVGEVMNIGNGSSVSLLQLVAKINGLAGAKIRPEFSAPRAGDVKRTKASTLKAKKLMHFSCRYSFDYGLRKTFDWFKENRGWFK